MLDSYDYILVGGGLQSGLIAAALAHRQPSASILLLEKFERVGGNHTWSFHPLDIAAPAAAWVQPFVQYRWPNVEVRLQGTQREISMSYASMSSEFFAERIAHIFESPRRDLRPNCEVLRVATGEVETADGRVIRGRLVVDNRGPQPAQSLLQCGYQKFFGFEVELDHDWCSAIPTIMDDSTEQKDGFRFFYALPFDSRRVLVEDTRFSNSPTIDRQECYNAVQGYLAHRGFHNFRVVREESGVLPMPFANIQMPTSTSPLAGGYRGGWFHAATGYSFPMAVNFADTLSHSTPEAASEAIAKLAEAHRWRAVYARFLNRLLFRLVSPRTRGDIFRRFYRVLSPAAIARFYAHQFTPLDAAKIVVGLPPRGLQPREFLKSFGARASTSSAIPAVSQNAECPL